MITTLISQNQNDAPLTFVDRVSAALLALGTIGLNNAVIQHRSGGNETGLLQLTIVYAPSAAASVHAVGFQRDAASSATAQANAFLAANPTYTVRYLFDIGSQNRRSLARDAIMLLYVDGGLPGCADFRGLIPVQSVGAIASGATGLVWQLTLGGNKGPYQATNGTQSVWAAGATGYAAADPLTCILRGYPSCCAGVPAITTTTPPPGT